MRANHLIQADVQVNIVNSRADKAAKSQLDWCTFCKKFQSAPTPAEYIAFILVLIQIIPIKWQDRIVFVAK